MLSQAQQTADRSVADAQEYSRELAEEGRLRRDEILREAKMRASMILEEAHANAGKAADAAGDARAARDSVLHNLMPRFIRTEAADSRTRQPARSAPAPLR